MPARLALTCGDPAGVGPEIVSAWLAEHATDANNAVVIGPARWLESLPPAVSKVAIGIDDFTATPGQPTGEGALVAWAAMEHAAQGCVAGDYAGVVTGPVSKAGLAAIGYPYPGQTEFFAARWGGDPVMAFCGGRLRVALATWHIPLYNVPQALGPQQLHRTIAAADELARAEGLTQPRIGVCGLNPHAGENGLLGEEERDFINPTLAKLRNEFPGLSFCLPADTLFARAIRGEFDVIVALYHDQGLAPLKAVDFDEAVNVTLGLPFVRTSPDHGTAFDIAGKGTAKISSYSNAVTVAQRLLRMRTRQ